MKVSKKQRDELESQVSSLQFDLQRQSDTLQKYERDHEGLTKVRMEAEERVEAVRRDYDDLKFRLVTEVRNGKNKFPSF